MQPLPRVGAEREPVAAPVRQHDMLLDLVEGDRVGTAAAPDAQVVEDDAADAVAVSDPEHAAVVHVADVERRDVRKTARIEARPVEGEGCVVFVRLQRVKVHKVTTHVAD